ncbi:MAG: hypothetical protein LBS19_12855, partial [Clostridiales bacterium]|nr:hypothetical protein [Clostridiales bacterium]
EVAVILVNYADYKGYEIPVNRDMPNYTDRQRIDMWADSATKKHFEASVLSSCNGKFEPDRESTRAEAAQMFKCFLRLIAGK